MEATVVHRSSRPLTAASLVPELRAAGVPVAGTVIVHSALSRLGWVAGGTQAVVEALTAALGPDGTLVMPTQSGGLSDPASWSRHAAARTGPGRAAGRRNRSGRRGGGAGRGPGGRPDGPRPGAAYDVVTAVAVEHHLPLVPALARLRALVRPGGRLVVVGCYRASTPADHATGLLAVPANLLVGLLRSAGTAPAGMSAPVAPATGALPEIRAAARSVLPGTRIRRRLFWRYTPRLDRCATARGDVETWPAG